MKLSLCAVVIFLLGCVVGSIDYRAAKGLESEIIQLQKKASECGRLYTVVNADGTIRCAQLVPGIVWQPYISPEDEERARLAYLSKLARGRR